MARLDWAIRASIVARRPLYEGRREEGERVSERVRVRKRVCVRERGRERVCERGLREKERVGDRV